MKTILSQNGMTIAGIVIAILFFFGIYKYLQNMYYFVKRRKLFTKHPDGVIYNNKHYLPDGRVSKDIPENIHEITVKDIKDIQRILCATFPIIDFKSD